MRLARSAVFTVVCLGLAAGAHRFAGGTAPAPWVLPSGALAVMTGTTLLARRERPPAAVVAWLLAAQLLLHWWFGAAGTSAVPRPHEHGVPGLSYGPGLGAGAGMLLAHLTAALLTGWWLARGEAALWSLLRVVGGYALRGLAVLGLLRRETPPPPRTVLPGDDPAARPGHDRVLRHALVRRGPPPVPALRGLARCA
ncbi:MFS transporter [Sphaerisporangium album]|uniref:MFS transporter n=1 Tax=Sphaerisporangium album TaxID=509200 RepID=A0A367FRS6_9ACTN|nr:MFS transporter [Sphaerisporangium album]